MIKTRACSRILTHVAGVSLMLLLTTTLFAQRKNSRDYNDTVNVANVVSVLVENNKIPVEIVKGTIDENRYWFTARSYTAPKGGCWITFLSPGGSFKIVDRLGTEQFGVDNTGVTWGQVLYILEGWSIQSTGKGFFSGFNKL